MSALDQLQAQVAQIATEQQALAASEAASKTALDSIQTGVKSIIAGLNPGGLSSDEVATLSTALGGLLTTEQTNAGAAAANATEAQADAATVAAAQPPASTPPVTTPPTDGTGTDTTSTPAS